MAILDTLNWLGESVTKPSAAVLGLMAGRPGQLANLIPFSDTMGLTNPRERTTGRGLLEGWGMSKNRPGLDMGDVAGFGVEMATDPLNWLGLGMIGRTSKAANAARATNATVATDRAAIDAANTASQAMRTAGALPEEMLPQMEKFYHAAPTTAEQIPIPGVLPMEMQPWRHPNQLYHRPVDFETTSPNALDEIEAALEAMSPRAGSLATTIRDQSLGYSDFPYNMSRQGHAAANSIDSSRPSNTYDATDYTFRDVFPEQLDAWPMLQNANNLLDQSGRIRNLQRQIPIRGSLRNQPNMQTTALRQAINEAGANPEKQNTMYLILADLLDNTPGMERYGEVLRSSEELANLTTKAGRTIADRIQPARAASQSFYAPREMDEIIWGTGDNFFEEILGEGTKTYLPHVAPQMKPYFSDFVNVPNASNTLKAMLGYNALAPMGRT
jgi:hypothetical protein